MLFSFVWLFRRFHYTFILWNSVDFSRNHEMTIFKNLFKILEKYSSVFGLYLMIKIFVTFLAKLQDYEFWQVGKEKLPKQKDFSSTLEHFLPFFFMKLLWNIKIFVHFNEVEKARTNEKRYIFFPGIKRLECFIFQWESRIFCQMMA